AGGGDDRALRRETVSSSGPAVSAFARADDASTAGAAARWTVPSPGGRNGRSGTLQTGGAGAGTSPVPATASMGGMASGEEDTQAGTKASTQNSPVARFMTRIPQALFLVRPSRTSAAGRQGRAFDPTRGERAPGASASRKAPLLTSES